MLRRVSDFVPLPFSGRGRRGDGDARRRLILDIIASEPGCSGRSIAKKTGITWSIVDKYLIQLEACGLIRRQFYRNRSLNYLAAHSVRNPQVEQALAHPGRARLFDWIRRHRDGQTGIGQAALVVQAESWGWKPSTTRTRISQLCRAGLLVAVPGPFLQFAVPEEYALDADKPDGKLDPAP